MNNDVALERDYEVVDWGQLKDKDNLEIIFASAQLRKILPRMNFKINEKKYVTTNEGKNIEALDGEDVKVNNISAILPGSRIFIRNNIASFSEYLSRYKK